MFKITAAALAMAMLFSGSALARVVTDSPPDNRPFIERAENGIKRIAGQWLGQLDEKCGNAWRYQNAAYKTCQSKLRNCQQQLNARQ